jgi:hypothetical protein
MAENNAPIIPVYLNQRIVFDLLAMLQDGLSQVAKITTTESDTQSIANEAGATFGVAQAFAGLLRIDLSGKRASAKESAGETARSEERVHTPASLFFKLRQMLIERGHLTVIDAYTSVMPRQMVEFTTTLRGNPVVAVMNTMESAFGMYTAFVEASNPQKGGSGKKAQTPESASNARVVAQMKSFRDAITSGSTIDIVTDPMAGGRAAVVTLEHEFISDTSMSNLIEGEFAVVGKVIRVVEEGQSVSLLRKAAINVLPEETLNGMFANFDALSAVHGFVVPRAEWQVRGPALHVVPIAIYA